MDYKQLQEFIKELANSGAAEVEVETNDLKIKVKTQSDEVVLKNTPVQLTPPIPQTNQSQIQQQHVQTGTQAEQIKEDNKQNLIYIKSPMVGTFYRRPAPDKPNFVDIGDELRTGQVVCIIEAMKLFNEIEAELTGKVVEILVEDATPVEYDQPLFALETK